ncbi:MAG TPA: C45 family peptidase [Lachnospiraceae bacterium]|nr:C45 family peptidase [Lachnospiraceae bacterium]
MYHVRFKGTHYDAGYKYGSALKKHGIVISSCPTFSITEEMKTFTAECIKEYEKYYPEILQEIKGMADGQESSFDFLCQMLFSMYCFKPDHHCTCFAFSDGDNIIFGRNSDFLVSIEKLYMNCLYQLDGVYAFNGNTTAIIEMEDGMNEYGLAIGLTFIYPHVRKPGLGAGLLLRYVLEKCKSTEEAISKLRELPIASSHTFTIADSSGKIAVVECNPEAFEVIYPKNGEKFVATANNFNSERMQQYKNPQDLDDWRSKDRYTTAKTALHSHKDRYSLDFAQNLLSGKYGFMCQYDRKKNADTVWSAIYDVKNFKIYRVEGNPSRKKYKEDERMAWGKI